MNSRGITRRNLLAAAVGAAAGGVLRPGGALAALADRAELGGASEPIRFEHSIGALRGASVAVDLQRNADLVGVQWTAPASAALELRYRSHDGSWSRWVPAGQSGHGPDLPAPPRRLTGEPVWTGGTSTVELRSAQTLSGVCLQLIDVSAGHGAHLEALASEFRAAAAALPLATPSLPAGAGQPPILARRAWAQGVAQPRVAPGYGAVKMAFVHHTENPNGYAPAEVPAMLRAIFAFHRYVNGWNDIGYNFVVDLFGRIFEARAGGIDEPVVGAHAGGYNAVSSGVAVLGSFMQEQISVAARQALQRLLAWKLSLHGVSSAGRVTVQVSRGGAVYSRFPAGAHVSLPRIAGHRDGDTTDCPGDALYGELPSIRRSVLHLAGHPARATLALTPAAPAAAVSSPETIPSSPAQVLGGAVALLDGAPIAGAPVEIQVRAVSRKGEVVRESTLAQAVTQADGLFSLPIALTPGPSGGSWLRALCPGTPGGPATVSEGLHLAGGVSFTPAPASAPTTPAATPPPT